MRKRTKRKVYGLVNPITHAIAGAAITESAVLDKLRLRELAAIEAFRTGKAGEQEWLDLADLFNITETLARDGVGPEALAFALAAQEALAFALAAQEALGAAHERHFKQGRIGLTGPELQALRDAYEYADLQRTSIDRSRYERAIKKTADKIRGAHPDVRVCVA